MLKFILENGILNFKVEKDLKRLVGIVILFLDK